MRRPLQICTGLALVMVLAQCVPATSPSASAPAPSQTAGTAPAANSSDGALLNAVRAENGRSALRPNAALNRAASVHARDMGTNNFIGHTGSDGSKMRERARRQGYSACHIAENVALGQGSASAVMNQWMNSPPHRRNILNGKSQDYGLARGPGNAWVLLLAQPGC
ncbi:CAP domain-containing protein [Roseovarius sp. 2305UL8-3]|uniref:CAP domain-containing protein n=1 Tax=Roseovarius conchicola TaxID=3121636 RepID=UPI0035276710